MTDDPFLQDLSATGHKAHRYPVERLVINHPRVATGAFHQVFLWDYGTVMVFIFLSTVPSNFSLSLHYFR
jgi:hypothetical protein